MGTLLFSMSADPAVCFSFYTFKSPIWAEATVGDTRPCGYSIGSLLNHIPISKRSACSSSNIWKTIICPQPQCHLPFVPPSILLKEEWLILLSFYLLSFVTQETGYSCQYRPARRAAWLSMHALKADVKFYYVCSWEMQLKYCFRFSITFTCLFHIILLQTAQASDLVFSIIYFFFH